MYELIPATDTRLNGISREITKDEFGSEFLQELIENMGRIAMQERDEEHPNRPTLVGLAAPQIGVFVQVILFDAAASSAQPNFNPDLQFVINPKIVKASDERELGREGCYSTGDIRAVVRRHTAVTVTGFDQDGKELNYNLTDFQARIVQHEIDHLNGVRCPDRIESPERLHKVLPDEFQDYRENWAMWDKFYRPEDWLRIKHGGA